MADTLWVHAGGNGCSPDVLGFLSVCDQLVRIHSGSKPAHIAVSGTGISSQLHHIPQDGDAGAFGGQMSQHGESRFHGGGIGVPCVIDQCATVDTPDFLEAHSGKFHLGEAFPDLVKTDAQSPCDTNGGQGV